MRHEVIAGPVKVLFEVIFGILHLIFNWINKRRVIRAINSGAVISLISLLLGLLEVQTDLASDSHRSRYGFIISIAFAAEPRH
jgi:hypothetical protein